MADDKRPHDPSVLLVLMSQRPPATKMKMVIRSCGVRGGGGCGACPKDMLPEQL
jgi:hypothetical protein